MTDEEAIKILESWKYPYPSHYADAEFNNAIDMAIEALKNKPDYDIVFLCDGKACGEDHDCMECRHTLDICHAKNFHYNDVLFDKNYYLEEDTNTEQYITKEDYTYNKKKHRWEPNND